MKYLILFYIPAFLASNNPSTLFTSLIGKSINIDNERKEVRMKITIDHKVYYATLYDNPTADYLKSLLPVTIKMTELNGNEKYYRFSKDFPINPSNPGTIHAGDLMIWETNTIVLFYKSFPTTYNYTKIGHVVDLSGLANDVGSNDVVVQFELE